MIQSDILTMLSHVAPKGTPPAELEAATSVFWGLMVQIDCDGESRGSDPHTRQIMLGYRVRQIMNCVENMREA